jgi:nicotinamide-nucleotide amidase
MQSDLELRALAVELAERLGSRGHTLVTAESCTGGWVGKVLTDIAGSSAWYRGGVVSYSNELKMALLGVRAETLATHGAVSAETAREMALGALERLGGTHALAVTGIAGPDGGTPTKPVGLVWFGWVWRDGREVRAMVAEERFAGDREAIRRLAVARSLRGVLHVLNPHG